MAPRAPDPHNLMKLAAKQPAPIIDVDRECHGCGYNLRGLRLGVKCPECGLPSVIVNKSDDPLSLMPMRVILAIVRGCWVAAICVAAMVGAVLADRTGAIKHEIAMAILAGLSVLWLGAVRWLTPAFAIPQAISRGFGPRSRVRRAARLLQIGWIVGTGCALLLGLQSNPKAFTAGLLSLGQWLGLMTGLAGLVVLSVLMERLSEWARDEDAQRMFNWAMWSWPLALLLYGAVQFFMGAMFATPGRVRIGAGLFVVLWIMAIGTFPYGLLMLAKSVTLSIVHNWEYQERTQRMQERDQRYRDRSGALAERTESEPMRPLAPPAPAARPPSPQPRPGPNPVPRPNPTPRRPG